MWVRYEQNGHEAPLEPNQATGSLTALGWVLKGRVHGRCARQASQLDALADVGCVLLAPRHFNDRDAT